MEEKCETKNMWCENNGCYHYDKENDKCTRIGINGLEGVCWMEKSEGEY